MAASTHQTRLKRDRRKAVFLFLSKEGYADRYGTESINDPPISYRIVYLPYLNFLHRMTEKENAAHSRPRGGHGRRSGLTA